MRSWKGTTRPRRRHAKASCCKVGCYNGGKRRMTGATLARPPVRHQEVQLPMLDHLTTPPVFGDPRLPARFWAKVNPNGPIPAHRPDLGPCWEWTASLEGNGYGHFWSGSRSDGSRKVVSSYRWAYEHLVAPVADGLELDHLCRNRPCVRPSHIEPVTHRENVLRGNAPSARGATAAVCPQGHPYDQANTYIWRGGRACRACRRSRGREIHYTTTRQAWLTAHRDELRAYKREWARRKWAQKR